MKTCSNICWYFISLFKTTIPATNKKPRIGKSRVYKKCVRNFSKNVDSIRFLKKMFLTFITPKSPLHPTPPHAVAGARHPGSRVLGQNKKLPKNLDSRNLVRNLRKIESNFLLLGFLLVSGTLMPVGAITIQNGEAECDHLIHFLTRI